MGSVLDLSMTQSAPIWPYVPTLSRLALALSLGMLIGIERERRRKEAGLRTFAFAALLGAVGGLLGDAYALLALGLLGVLLVLLNVETIRTGEGAEITTSAALLVTGYMGVLAGQGQAFTPTALGVAVAALLAWKEPLAGFSRALTDAELRSAILLAILAFIVYPILPPGSVDPWHLIEPQAAWVTVILIAALGFVNYILLKLYGARGILLGSFLGGLVNSTVTVTDLAERVEGASDRFTGLALRGVALATAAMLLRNAVLLTLISPSAGLAAAVPLVLMITATLLVALLRRREDQPTPQESSAAVAAQLRSPFSLQAAIRFGLIFLALQVVGSLAERALGQTGFYAVSAIGGLVSSASAVASAASLSAAGTLPPNVAAIGALLASIASGVIHLPMVARAAHDRRLTRRVAAVLATLIIAAALGVGVQLLVTRLAL
ncbi:MAG: MgtC/SapB family protein [Gemmatimonadales bacterium]